MTSFSFLTPWRRAPALTARYIALSAQTIVNWFPITTSKVSHPCLFTLMECEVEDSSIILKSLCTIFHCFLQSVYICCAITLEILKTYVFGYFQLHKRDNNGGFVWGAIVVMMIMKWIMFFCNVKVKKVVRVHEAAVFVWTTENYE